MEITRYSLIFERRKRYSKAVVSFIKKMGTL